MKMISMQLLVYVGTCIPTSAATFALYKYGVIDNYDYFEYCMVILCCFAIFIACNILLMRKQYLRLHDRKLFRKRSYTAYGIFMLFTVVTYSVSHFTMTEEYNERVGSWLFTTLKLAKFTVFDVPTLPAMLISHSVMLIIIPFVPSIAKATTKRIRGRRVW